MIGERLRSLRKLHKIRQEDLAEILGVKGAAISRYEANKDTPSDAIKVKIAEHFNISLDYLLGVIDQEVPYYQEGSFLKLPDAMTHEDMILLKGLVEYVEHKANNCK